MMELVAFLAGYAFALVGGFFCVGIVVKLLWKLDPNPPSASTPQGSRLVGLVERALYVTTIVLGREGFVVVWLAMKVATDWRLERHRGRPPKLAYNTFLVGTGLSLLFAVVGAMIVRWGTAGPATQWWYSLIVVVVLLGGVEGLRRILLHSLDSKQKPSGQARATWVPERAAPVNRSLAEPPLELEGETLEELGENSAERNDGPFGRIDLPAGPPPGGGDGRVAATEQDEPEPGDENLAVVELVPERRSRRTPEEIEQLSVSVQEHLRANPWQGVNEIAAALSTNSQELRRPLHVLLSNRKIRKRGQGRTTEYRTGTVRKQKTKKSARRTR